MTPHLHPRRRRLPDALSAGAGLLCLCLLPGCNLVAGAAEGGERDLEAIGHRLGGGEASEDREPAPTEP